MGHEAKGAHRELLDVTLAAKQLRIYMDAPYVPSAFLRWLHRRTRMQLYIRPVGGHKIPGLDRIC
jgi:hypothetical protein